MLLSVALAFAAAAPAEASVQPQTPSAPAAKPRRVCRNEEVIGSLTPKRVCVTLPPRNDAAAAKPQALGSTQQPASPAVGSNN
jgi:hypothetical protein